METHATESRFSPAAAAAAADVVSDKLSLLRGPRTTSLAFVNPAYVAECPASADVIRREYGRRGSVAVNNPRLSAERAAAVATLTRLLGCDHVARAAAELCNDVASRGELEWAPSTAAAADRHERGTSERRDRAELLRHVTVSEDGQAVLRSHVRAHSVSFYQAFVAAARKSSDWHALLNSAVKSTSVADISHRSFFWLRDSDRKSCLLPSRRSLTRSDGSTVEVLTDAWLRELLADGDGGRLRDVAIVELKGRSLVEGARVEPPPEVADCKAAAREAIALYRAHLAPAGPHLAPAGPHGAPAESHSAPAESHSAPAESHSAPAESHSTPVGSHSTPVTPVEST